MSKSQIKKKWKEPWKRSDDGGMQRKVRHKGSIILIMVRHVMGKREHCDNDETVEHVVLHCPQCQQDLSQDYHQWMLHTEMKLFNIRDDAGEFCRFTVQGNYFFKWTELILKI